MKTKLACIRLKCKYIYQKRGTENVSSEIREITGIGGNVWHRMRKFPQGKSENG